MGESPSAGDGLPTLMMADQKGDDAMEYLNLRCCMCPNRSNPEATQCPAGSPCRFVKSYIDNRAWIYRVMSGLGEDNYKARYSKPGKSGWKCMTNMDWRKSFDEAQADLNEMAKSKGWEEWIE